MSVPSWPSYSDDAGDDVSGTILNAAFFNLLQDAISGGIHGIDNPSTIASDIIDEVVRGRGIYSDLAARFNAVSGSNYGITNPTIPASTIIDEVVAARGATASLSLRLAQAIQSSGVPVSATAAVPGAIDTGVQTFAGAKTFNGALTLVGAVEAQSALTAALGASSTRGQVSRFLGSDVVQHVTPQNSTNAVITTYSIPANFFDTANRCLKVIYECNNIETGANAHTLILDIGGSTFNLRVDTTARTMQTIIYIWRASANTLSWSQHATVALVGTGVTGGTTGALTFSNANTLRFLATTGAASTITTDFTLVEAIG